MVVSEKPKDATSRDRKHRLKHRFEVVKKLGQGTYGKVQLAINKETSQEVAIKTIKKSKIESEQDLVRIRREIQIMSSIQHPQIIHIYEVFENKEKIVLVMQYASGGELYDYLSERKVLTDTEARRIFRQIAAAIYYCHKNKICHRDLKLENVLLDERGNAKIADFGLSNVFDDRHLLGTFCGSPLYASPEIVKGTPYYGPEVDCWSMGVLLYTLVYGAMPFDGSNFKRLVKQISEGDYYEPKKKSDASGLIRQLLTVSATKRATIIDICTNWWVNQGYEHSLLQVAEDMANLTPVRIDLLLALAPVSPPPPNETAEKQEHPLAKKVEKKETKEPAAEGAASDSFSFISGGMANNMKNISSENPDDIFHGEENSDEEFLPADVAAALEGQCSKRPAEKSFEGSMMRVSSMAHRNKKPRKSESVGVQSLGKVGTKEEDLKTNEEEVSTAEENPMLDEMEQEVQSECEQVAVPTMSDVQEKEAVVSPQIDSSSEVLVPSTVPETEIPTEGEVVVKSEDQESSSPTVESSETKVAPCEKPEQKSEVKKIKPKVPPKVTADKPKKETSPTKTAITTKSRERSPQKMQRVPEKRERSPQKTQVVKPQERRDRSPQKSKPDERRDKSPQKNQVQKSQERRDPSPHKNHAQRPQERRDVSPQKNQTSKPQEKTTDAAKRRPGKLIMPKFLDSNQSSPSPPKSADAKKVVVPYRSVSDAKRNFEVNKRSPPSLQKKEEKQPLTPVKKDDKPVSPGKRIIYRKKKDVPAEKTDDRAKSSPEECKADISPTNESATALMDKKYEAQVSAEETTTQQEEGSPKGVHTAGDNSPKAEFADGETTPVPSEDEEKRLAAKSILKKTIAKAKLAERKMSQQSSVDSETGSCTPPVLSGNSNSNSKSSLITAGPSYFKIPKPFVKEESASKVESKAEIVLSPTRKTPTEEFPSKEDQESSSKEETIWGPPLYSPGNSRPLQKSILSTSIESDMNNWRQEVEESLKRLSPEGASDDAQNHKSGKETSSQDIGPAPISRSYKKFTFTKDGSCITETGEVYTAPRDDGMWTKVEKKTKVTTMPSIKEDYNKAKSYREASPLRHSDSQSSSGSNDIFDDIFDSWTGDSMVCNRMKNLFGRFSDSLRRDRRRESMRRPRSERDKLRGGNLTDRECSDNDDDFDVHYDNERPVMYGSQGLWQFMKSVNRDFPMRGCREYHGPSYSRSLSRERRDSDAGQRSRDSCRPTDYYPVRSTSRDRTQSPRETVLKFVIGSPRRQSSFNSEPRSCNENWREKMPSQWEPNYVLPTSVDSPEAFTDRASVYGTIRPKVFQRYMKMRNEYPESPLTTPLSTKSGPELVNKGWVPPEDLDENRRKRVEHWLQMNSKDPEQHRTKFYTRSSSDNISVLDEHPSSEERRTPSTASLDDSKKCFRSEVRMDSNSPLYRTISEIQFNNRMSNSQESLNSRHYPIMEDQFSRQPNHGNVKYTRSLSNNMNQIGISTPPNSVVEVETPVASPSSGQQTPILRMRVSFNRNNSEDSQQQQQQQQREGPSSAGIWNQVSSPQSDFSEGRSLLEALKMRGYRNIMSQRLHNMGPAAEQGPPLESAVPEGAEQDQGSAAETPQRGKAARYAYTPKADDSNACCMETNHSEKTSVPNGEVSLSDGTLTPDSLDGKGSAGRASTTPCKNYEEESVSDRIRRKSYFMRFNDDRPKRRTSKYRDNFVSDLPGSVWSRFSDDSFVDDDDVLMYPRIPRRTGSFRTPKRSSANLEELLDYRMSTDGLYRSSSRSSQILDGFLSDDGLWNSSYASRRASSASNNGWHGGTYGNGTHEEETGSLWKQRTSRSFARYQPSVIDTVPDLGEVWKSSRPSAFSFYSPTVTPKSPVVSPHDSVTPTDSGDVTPKRRVVVGPQFSFAEETEDQNFSHNSHSNGKEENPQDVLSKALDVLSNMVDK